MKTQSSRRSSCPISITLEMMGDSWSLLVVRDLLFTGATRFNEFLGAEEKIATNILSDRLLQLECAGIIEKLRDPHDGRRHIYRLTKKGIDLAPILVEMILWASHYEKTAAPPAMVQAMQTDRAGFIANLQAQWETR
jgi:DNA-binding HxlR family transcriptional regulator